MKFKERVSMVVAAAKRLTQLKSLSFECAHCAWNNNFDSSTPPSCVRQELIMTVYPYATAAALIFVYASSAMQKT